MSDSYYERVNGSEEPAGAASRFVSTIHTQGAWQETEQHMAAASGVIAHELLRHEPREDMRLGRISFEILGMISRGEFTIEVETVRPGRTIELLEATMTANGRPCIVARAWRLKHTDTTAVEHHADRPMPGPEHTEPARAMDLWPGGFIRSLEIRAVEEPSPGSGRCWIRNPYSTVHGEPSYDLARLIGMVDTANGIAPVVEPGGDYTFPNVDLQIHFYREPTGQWLGLETVVNAGGEGVGLTSSVLHDENGPFGRAQQLLTLRPMPSAQTTSQGPSTTTEVGSAQGDSSAGVSAESDASSTAASTSADTR